MADLSPSQAAFTLDVVMDDRNGQVRVDLDGRSVLDAITFLVAGDQATTGSTANPADPTRFTGTIRNLPVRTPLCDSVRSQAKR